jgi:hypothetical protein
MNIFDETLVIVVESANVAGVYSVNGKAGYVTIDKSDIGLSNVENVSITGDSSLQVIDLYSGITGEINGIIFNNWTSSDSTNLGFTTTGYYFDYEISNNGQYHVAIGKANVGSFLINTGYGSGNWVTKNLPDTIQNNPKIAISDNLRCISIIDGFQFGGRPIYTSRNSGNSFTNIFQTNPITDIAMSTNGRYQIITQAIYATNAGSVRTSTNSGISWSVNNNVPSRRWQLVDVSTDFKNQVIAEKSGVILISHNSGVSWFTGIYDSKPWRDLQISPDGKTIMAISNNKDYIWISENSGITWTQESDLKYWRSVTLSTLNNTKLAVGVEELETSPKIIYGKYNNESWSISPNIIPELTGRNNELYPEFNSSIDTLKIRVSKNNNIIGVIDDSDQIDLPIFTNTFSTGIAAFLERTAYQAYPIVYTYANQTISGIKNFTTRPTVNNTGILIQGDLLFVQDAVFATGNQTISGIKNFTTRPTVNNTGVLLQGEAAANVENVLYTTGKQTISGQKSFAAQNFIFSGVNLTLKNGTLLTSEIGSTGVFNSKNTFTANNTFSGTTYFDGLPYFRYPSIAFSTDPNLGNEEWYYEFIPAQNGDITFQYISGETFTDIKVNFKEENLINASGINLTISGVSYPIKKILPIAINSTNYRIPLF